MNPEQDPLREALIACLKGPVGWLAGLVTLVMLSLYSLAILAGFFEWADKMLLRGAFVFLGMGMN